jgi:3-methyladenine DNA glycosylase/8-oxoguanine DNA glycosylase
VKRAQEAFDDITQRFERRINEITEMQRLSEERFRQEWVSFRAEDQKRWTNYSLVGEEQQREITRQFEKYSERLTEIDDVLADAQDALRQLTAETQKRLQGLLAVAHDWVEEFDRSFGRSG